MKNSGGVRIFFVSFVFSVLQQLYPVIFSLETAHAFLSLRISKERESAKRMKNGSITVANSWGEPVQPTTMPAIEIKVEKMLRPISGAFRQAVHIAW